VDWTINSQGERDGTDYLVESVVPAIERGIVGALAPALFEECGVRRKLRRLYVGGNVVGVDMSPEDFPLPQIGMLCPLLLSYLSFTKTPFSEYTPSDPLQSIQCHRMEGAFTVYFPPNYAYNSQIPSITLQTLNAIKDAMDNGSLLSSHESVLALKFLDSSYSSEPIVPGGAAASTTRGSGGGNKGGLAAGLVIMFLFLGLLGFFGWRKYKKLQEEEDYEPHQREVDFDNDNEVDLKDSMSTNDQVRIEEEESYTSDSDSSSDEEGSTTSGNEEEDGESYSNRQTPTESLKMMKRTTMMSE
jgi:hypothetical protein